MKKIPIQVINRCQNQVKYLKFFQSEFEVYYSIHITIKFSFFFNLNYKNYKNEGIKITFEDLIVQNL